MTYFESCLAIGLAATAAAIWLNFVRKALFRIALVVGLSCLLASRIPVDTLAKAETLAVGIMVLLAASLVSVFLDVGNAKRQVPRTIFQNSILDYLAITVIGALPLFVLIGMFINK